MLNYQRVLSINKILVSTSWMSQVDWAQLTSGVFGSSHLIQAQCDSIAEGNGGTKNLLKWRNTGKKPMVWGMISPKIIHVSPA